MAISIVTDSDDRGGSAAAGQPTDQVFRLFDLPPELWIRVCHFAVIEGTISIGDIDDHKSVARAVAQPALTQTCRTLRKEALKMFYAGNEFEFRDEGHNFHFGLKRWLHALGPESAALLKHCRMISREADIIKYVMVRLDIIGVRFHDDAPVQGEEKELKFTVQVPKGGTHNAA